MPRHGMQYCLLCNPFGNGTSGSEGTEAIGKYYVENIPGEDQHTTGWHGVCEMCAKMVMNQGYEVTPLDGYEDHPVFADIEEDVEHECDDPSWTKASLVTESEGFDWVQCDDCGIYGKRWGLTTDTIEVVGYER